MALNLNAEADALEGAAFALEQSLRPQLDAIKFMRDTARRLRQGGQPGPAGETTPPQAA